MSAIGNAQGDHCLIVIMVELQVNNMAAGGKRVLRQYLLTHNMWHGCIDALQRYCEQMCCIHWSEQVLAVVLVSRPGDLQRTNAVSCLVSALAPPRAETRRGERTLCTRAHGAKAPAVGRKLVLQMVRGSDRRRMPVVGNAQSWLAPAGRKGAREAGREGGKVVDEIASVSLDFALLRATRNVAKRSRGFHEPLSTSARVFGLAEGPTLSKGDSG